jgi:soluble lytic murein transglycosylase-like protein
MRFKIAIVALCAVSSLAGASAKQAPKPSTGGRIVMNSVDVPVSAVMEQAASGSLPLDNSLQLEQIPREIVLGRRVEREDFDFGSPVAPASNIAERLQFVEQLMTQAGFPSRFNPGAVAQQAMLPAAFATATGNPGPSVADSMSSAASGLGAPCEAYPFRPTGLLKPEGQRRRELLFPYMRSAACEAGVPVALFDALIIHESRYKALAISPKGAVGLSQLLPGTAKELGVDPWTVVDNLRGGAKYLRQQLDSFGAPHTALAAYNAGPAAVQKYNGIPRYRETINYVQDIMSMWDNLSFN